MTLSELIKELQFFEESFGEKRIALYDASHFTGCYAVSVSTDSFGGENLETCVFITGER